MQMNVGQFPPRAVDALTGSEWLKSIGVNPDSMSNSPDKIGCGPEREQALFDQISGGNVPDFMRTYCPVQIEGGGRKATIYVPPDYLCLGTNDDFVRARMAPKKLQELCNLFDCTLPTCKMVNTIWKQSVIKVAPTPMTPEQGYPRDASMMWTCRWPIVDRRIKAEFDRCKGQLGNLTAGQLKDVVITIELDGAKRGHQVAIFGWHQLNGQIIQDLNTHSHEFTYKDYSHGARLVANWVVFDDGTSCKITDALMDPQFYRILSDEPKPFQYPNYPA